ncbi:hypothetical protein ACIA8R_32595 [Nonomuraea sp. NPDC051191]|uniref:hypothetical protein n=1 Tax=Nonomuraea sp. NPDC051191 TaxID=3364372 RepID=UPI00379DF5CB
MSHVLSPGPGPAGPAHLLAAQDREHLLRTELPRVREAAVAWRNGLGGLLAALVGFSLIKGRTDVGQLDRGWAVVVGVLLLIALVVGAVAALLLIRAAHGRPAVAPTRTLPPRRAADHLEALDSAAALRRGIALTLLCAALLVAAIGATWYGPEAGRPSLSVTTPAGTTCGAVVRVAAGRAVLRTRGGEVTADLAAATAIEAVEACA